MSLRLQTDFAIPGETARCRPRALMSSFLEQREHPIEESLLCRPIEQPLPELGEDGEVEPGIFQLKAERVLPIEACADGVGGLAVGEVPRSVTLLIASR